MSWNIRYKQRQEEKKQSELWMPKQIITIVFFIVTSAPLHLTGTLLSVRLNTTCTTHLFLWLVQACHNFYSRLSSLITPIKKISTTQVCFCVNVSRFSAAATQDFSWLHLEWRCPGRPFEKVVLQSKSQDHFFWSSFEDWVRRVEKNDRACFRAFSIVR